MSAQLVLRVFLVLVIPCLSLLATGEESAFRTTLRDGEGLLTESEAQPFSVQENAPQRRVRDYPMQPPTIPHAIEGYVLTRPMNQCLVCHDTRIAPQMGAPAVAVSHFQNREGQYLMNVSPRRYFCTQCHVPQDAREPLVGNRFRAGN